MILDEGLCFVGFEFYLCIYYLRVPMLGIHKSCETRKLRDIMRGVVGGCFSDSGGFLQSCLWLFVAWFVTGSSGQIHSGKNPDELLGI